MKTTFIALSVMLFGLGLTGCVNNTLSSETPSTKFTGQTKEARFIAKNYEYSIKGITVDLGTQVTVYLESQEGVHNWVLDEFNAETSTIEPGDPVASVTFIADKPGTYQYYCSIGDHRAKGMTGTFTVK